MARSSAEDHIKDGYLRLSPLAPDSVVKLWLPTRRETVTEMVGRRTLRNRLAQRHRPRHQSTGACSAPVRTRLIDGNSEQINMVDYQRVHEEAIVFDGACPLLTHSPEHTSYYVEGGVTVAAPSLAANHNCREAIMRIADWLNIIRERHHELMRVTDIAGFRQAKAEDRLGILFHFQNSLPLEQCIELVDVYHARRRSRHSIDLQRPELRRRWLPRTQ